MSDTDQELQGGVRKVPDVWTEYPEIVRDLLQEAGFNCGVEPRILEGRDPDWTCIIDGQRIGGDIYIHQADTILGTSMGTAVFALLGALTAVLLVALWQAWVIIRLKRRARVPDQFGRARSHWLPVPDEKSPLLPPHDLAGAGRGAIPVTLQNTATAA